jgi:hypothetical protein
MHNIDISCMTMHKNVQIKKGIADMAFRADEAATSGYEQLRSYLIPRNFPPDLRARSEKVLSEIVATFGPAVDGYPSWHPLVRNHDEHHPQKWPSKEAGYKGLDHTCYLAHGFITCPYGDGEDVLESVRNLPFHHAASISAEKIDAKFYNETATPILVRCEWSTNLESGMLIPTRLAVPLMIEQELPCWAWSERAETWETMRPYLLGEPHGNRSSLFVGQDAALALKKMYLAMTDSGMFGPIKER